MKTGYIRNHLIALTDEKKDKDSFDCFDWWEENKDSFDCMLDCWEDGKNSIDCFDWRLFSEKVYGYKYVHDNVNVVKWTLDLFVCYEYS